MTTKKANRFGIRHYAMINSGVHLLSTFPLSSSLSLAGSNNLGKTQAIQSMQYIFFNNQQHMSFKPHDLKASREFFFPKENSFLLMEVMLPTGIFIIGAYGKGASSGYEYENFVVKGDLNTNDFLENNRLLTYKEVFAKWSEQGREFLTLSREEMRQLLYGEYIKVKSGNWDVTLAPIANASERRYGIFRQIYGNLLSQTVLKSKELKDLILSVFSDKLANASINFTQVRKEAFRDHSLQQAEIKAIEDRKQDILTLFNEKENLKDKSAEGRVLCRQLKVNVENAALMYPQAIQGWEADLRSEQDKKAVLTRDNKTHTDTLTRLHRQKALHDAMAKEISELTQRTSLGSQAQTEASLEAVRREIAVIETSLTQAESFNPDAIKRKLGSVEANLKTLSDKLARLKDGDGLAHSLGFDSEQIDELSRVLHPALFGLSKHHLKEPTPGNFKSYLLAHVMPENGVLERAGFKLTVDSIAVTDFQLDQIPELEMQINLEKQSLVTLRRDLDIANDQAGTRNKLAELKNQAKKLNNSVHDYERLQQLQEEYLQKKEDICALEMEIEELTVITSGYGDRLDELNALIQKLGSDLDTMRRKQRSIQGVQEKMTYKIDFFGVAEGDDDAYTLDLNEVDFDEVLARLNSLEAGVKAIQNVMKGCQDRIIDNLTQLAEHVEFDLVAEKAKEMLDALPQTRQWLKRLHEHAVIKVSGALQDLNQNYLQLEHEITLFNRSIGARKISNLKRFSVELRRNDVVLESIDTLLKNMNNSDFSADLFAGNVEEITDSELRRALDRLSRVVEDGKDGNLEVADLFELSFTVVDGRGHQTTSEKLDDMASNGSSKALKPLLFMSLIRHLMDKKVKHETFLPFYLDEAADVDENNQATLLRYCEDLGFTPIFASVHPTLTADFCVNLAECVQDDQRIMVTQEDWQHIIHHDDAPAEDQLELPA